MIGTTGRKQNKQRGASQGVCLSVSANGGGWVELFYVENLEATIFSGVPSWTYMLAYKDEMKKCMNTWQQDPPILLVGLIVYNDETFSNVNISQRKITIHIHHTQLTFAQQHQNNWDLNLFTSGDLASNDELNWISTVCSYMRILS